MYRSAIRVVLLALLTVLFASPTRVEAAKIPFLITTGDSISKLGPVPTEQKVVLEKLTEPGVEVGYAYSYFGLFFLDAWTWDGKYCLYHGKSYWKLNPEQAAAMLGVPQDKLPKPFLYRFPSLLLVLLLGVVALVIIQRFTKTDEEQAAELMKDERYQEALKLFREQYAQAKSEAAQKASSATATEVAQDKDEKDKEEVDDSDAEEQRVKTALDAAVALLISKGVPKEEAAKKLEVLTRVEAIEK